MIKTSTFSTSQAFEEHEAYNLISEKGLRTCNLSNQKKNNNLLVLFVLFVLNFSRRPDLIDQSRACSQQCSNASLAGPI